MRRLLTAISAVVLLALVGLYLLVGRTAASPEQPIPFSHQNHVEVRQIDCAYCHSGATSGAVAGIPPLETCMGCHQTVGADKPGVQTLRQYWDEQQPVEWVKLTRLPDHTSFTHAPHTTAGVECLTCHGQGTSSENWFPVFEPGMGWCLSCHNQQGASTDCWVCHR